MRRLAILLLAGGAVALGAGLWMPAKAATAQILLRLAWERSAISSEGTPRRPWPWARTWPVARLRVPLHGVDVIVLAGAEGASLAFAPGHVDGTARPGQDGNVVLAAHRDTHFRFLADLGPGDELLLEAPGAATRRYRVADGRVVDERQTAVLAATAEPTLTLVTCYPFDAVRPGGPLRYVVRATAVSEVALSPS